MSRDLVKIIFQPDGKKVKVPKGTRLIAAAEEAGVYLDTPCGGKGICGKCRVQLSPIRAEEKRAWSEFISDQEWNDGWRLACQTVVDHDITVHIPESVRKFAHKILESGIKVQVTPEPNIRKYFVQLDPPNLARQKSDWEILSEKVPEQRLSPQQDLSILSQMPTILRDAKYQVTATLTDAGKLISIEPGDTASACYGIAFDIGTTTVVGTLIDLVNGKELAVAAEMNAQSVFGADVISRIQFAMQEPDGVKQLHHKIVEVMNRIIATISRKAKIQKEHIYEITIVGNTTMQHLVLNLSPATLGALPYVPILKFGLAVPAYELNIRGINPGAQVYMLPNIVGFVGADTVGVILATDAHRSEKIRLLIDLGTNSEIVLGNKDKLICCSAAAGPAFEAAHIEKGMRAAGGAIDHVWLDPSTLLRASNSDIRISTIDNIPPIGICGTGIIDATAVLVHLGIIDSTGRIVNQDEADKSIRPEVKERIVEMPNGNRFILSHSKNIYLTQRDIREVQLAKGAIATGIQILKDRLSITDDQIDEVLLAGAFGHYILPESVVKIGLIPQGLAQKIVPVGNAASTGAKLALLSLPKRNETTDIAKHTDHLELALQPEFESQFADNLSFPATNNIPATTD